MLTVQRMALSSLSLCHSTGKTPRNPIPAQADVVELLRTLLGVPSAISPIEDDDLVRWGYASR